jgi:ribosomal protein S1
MSANLLPSPQFIPGTYHPGLVLDGRIVHVASFGVFLELEPGVHGLLHLSQMKGFPMETEVPAMGTSLRVRIVAIDTNRGLVALSLNPEP